MQQPETLSDLINFVSFGHLFCQDLDLAILLHQDVHLAQTELYQMDLLDGIACATKASGKQPGHCVPLARSALRVYLSSGLPFGRPPDKYLPCCPPWPRLSTDSQNTERHWHPQSSATCGAQPDRAKRGSPSEPSEVLRCERSEPVMPRRRRRVKLRCVETRMCPN